jgi:transposase
MTWHAKEATRTLYDIAAPELAEEYLCELAIDMQDDSHPPEVQSLGRTLARWFDEIVAWHKAFVSNGPTEAVNNLMKRIKRVGFGFRSFVHYRVRVLLYAGRPNWQLLPTLTPR